MCRSNGLDTRIDGEEYNDTMLEDIQEFIATTWSRVRNRAVVNSDNSNIYIRIRVLIWTCTIYFYIIVLTNTITFQYFLRVIPVIYQLPHNTIFYWFRLTFKPGNWDHKFENVVITLVTSISTYYNQKRKPLILVKQYQQQPKRIDAIMLTTVIQQNDN